jgi:hypothetical protein
MAIVKTKDGKFYDIDDNIMEGKEVAPPEGAAQQSGPGPGGPGFGSGGPIQIIVNLPPPGGAPPPGGQPPAGEQTEEAGQLQDVAGHWRHHWGGGWGGGGWGGWANFWRNCWRNFYGPPGY